LGGLGRGSLEVQASDGRLRRMGEGRGRLGTNKTESYRKAPHPLLPHSTTSSRPEDMRGEAAGPLGTA
jgi:hypothetical protein